VYYETYVSVNECIASLAMILDGTIDETVEEERQAFEVHADNGFVLVSHLDNPDWSHVMALREVSQTELTKFLSSLGVPLDAIDVASDEDMAPVADVEVIRAAVARYKATKLN
jgi:hypothetical protein